MKQLELGILTAALMASAASAAPPCDFMGVSVGDRITQTQFMEKLGAVNFENDPPSIPFEQLQPMWDKYGIIGTSEIEGDKIGPYCRPDWCRIPHGVSVGNSSIPVKVHASFNNGVITEIDISFSATFWDEIFDVIQQKYGRMWDIAHQDLAVTDFATKEFEMLPRINAETKMDGLNPTTGDTCHFWATNIDIVFVHHDILGPLHSSFVIKLNSRNF
jgi:hypothetical protein